MRTIRIVCLLGVVTLCGCTNGPYTLTFGMNPDNTAAVVAYGDHPTVLLQNHGPATVVVRSHELDGDQIGEASTLRAAERMDCQIDAPLRVTIETGPGETTMVTCVLEGATGCNISAGTPKK